MNNVRVIAFSGWPGSGKSTCAKITHGFFGGQNKVPTEMPTVLSQRISIAAPVKEIAEKLYGWDGDKVLYTTAVGAAGLRVADMRKGRGLLQAIAEKGREIDPDVWIKNSLRAIRNQTWVRTQHASRVQAPDPMNVFIIDDLRYRNEAVALRGVFGARAFLVRVYVPGSSPSSTHQAERDLDNWDDFNTEICNDGSMEQLNLRVQEFLGRYLKAPNAPDNK